MKFWWYVVTIQGVCGLVALTVMLLDGEMSAPQQGAAAATIAAWSVVPYVIARAQQALHRIEREKSAAAAVAAAVKAGAA